MLSGGLDSTVCLALEAKDRKGASPLVALTFDYGQRHRVELDRAAAIAAHYDADHLVVRIDASAWGGSALTDEAIEVPDANGGAETDDIPVTYVPARNLIFLSVALGVAEARDLDSITIGVNALDYSGYPDCRPEFIASFTGTAALALKRGVDGNPIGVRTPLLDRTKEEIVRLGVELGAPIDLTWSCYRGSPDQRPCGTCDACVLRANGFASAGLDDPALAAH